MTIIEHVIFWSFCYYCSDGCGRTGSFIAMCLLIDRLKTEGVVDIFQTVRGLRLQRPGMVDSLVRSDYVQLLYTCNISYYYNNYYLHVVDRTII